jgi:hypothetical protein
MIIEDEATKTQKVITASVPTTFCPHTHAEQRPCPPPHWAELRCKSCGQHLRYIASPATIELRRRNSVKIEMLNAIITTLEPWMMSFLATVSRSRNGKLVGRQQITLDSIWRQYFPQEAAAEEAQEEAQQ